MQIAVKEDGVRRIVEHLGSAHHKTELAALLEVGRQKIAAWQGQGLLDLESLAPAAGRTGLASTTVESNLSCTGWGGLCFRVGFFVGILGVGWSFRGAKAAVGSGG